MGWASLAPVVATIAACSGFAYGLTSFGDAIIFQSLWTTWFVLQGEVGDLERSLAILLVMEVPTAILLSMGTYRSARPDMVWSILPGMGTFVFVGTWAVSKLPGDSLRFILGSVFFLLAVGQFVRLLRNRRAEAERSAASQSRRSPSVSISRSTRDPIVDTWKEAFAEEDEDDDQVGHDHRPSQATETVCASTPHPPLPITVPLGHMALSHTSGDNIAQMESAGDTSWSSLSGMVPPTIDDEAPTADPPPRPAVTCTVTVAPASTATVPPTNTATHLDGSADSDSTRCDRFAAQLQRPVVLGGIVTGITAGFLTGAFGTGGPPVMVYFAQAGVDKSTVRGTFGLIAGLLMPMRLISAFLFGIFRVEDIPLYAIACTAALLGMYFGGKLHKRVDTQAIIVFLMVLVFASSQQLTGSYTGTTLGYTSLGVTTTVGVALLLWLLWQRHQETQASKQPTVSSGGGTAAAVPSA